MTIGDRISVRGNEKIREGDEKRCFSKPKSKKIIGNRHHHQPSLCVHVPKSKLNNNANQLDSMNIVNFRFNNTT